MDKENKHLLFTDCVHFPLDRPCVYQKNADYWCQTCKNYSKVCENGKNRILIIKLGAMGDVLRTTFILEGLKKSYCKYEIFWLVDKDNACVLDGNELIDSVILNDEHTNEKLVNNFYDIVVNLDLSADSLAFAKLANKSKLKGYSLNDERNIICSNSHAQEWLDLSAYDVLKKSNQKTYQYYMSKIAELPNDKYEIIVPLNKFSIEKCESFAKKYSLNFDKKIIGLNPGAGKRWRLKKWQIEKYCDVAKHFSDKGFSILLLGGPNEQAEIGFILNKNIKNVISCGTKNSVQDFFAYLNLCNVLICSDTMALHAALGLKKNVVVLFGPTSMAEIEVYDRGKKIQPNKNCVCCYLQDCKLKDNCMEAISVEEVIKATESFL